MSKKFCAVFPPKVRKTETLKTVYTKIERHIARDKTYGLLGDMSTFGHMLVWINEVVHTNLIHTTRTSTLKFSI